MRFILCLFAFLSYTSTFTGQTLADYTADPNILAEAYVRGQIQPIDSALTGEAAENPISLSKLPKAPRIKTIPHWKKEDRALVAVEFSNESSAQDLYLFLDSTTTGWKISSLREFVLPSMYYQQMHRYRNKGERSIREDYNAKLESSTARGVTKAEHETVHGTVESKIFYVFNLRLASSADRDLVRHFNFLKKDFETVRNIVDTIAYSPIALEHDNPKIGSQLQYILVKRVYHAEGYPMRFEIAAIEGKSMGFLYCDKEECMPTPTPGGVISLLDLGDGWWLYRKV